MAWHLNIVAIKTPYSKLEDYLDVLTVKESNASFEKATSSLEDFTMSSTFLNGYSLLFNPLCIIFHNKDMYNKIFEGEEIKLFQILQTPGYKYVAEKKNKERLTGIKEFKDEFIKRNIEMRDKKDGEVLAWQLFDDKIFGKQSQGINDDLWNAKFDLWEV